MASTNALSSFSTIFVMDGIDLQSDLVPYVRDFYGTDPAENAGGTFDYTVSILGETYQITYEYETEYVYSERWLSISLYGADLTDDASDTNGSLMGYSAVDGSDRITFATSYEISEAEFEQIANGSLAGYALTKTMMGGNDLLSIKDSGHVYTYGGDDVIFAVNVASVWGGDGNDIIVGSTQVFYGEDGDDYIDISMGANEYITTPASAWGGRGNDTLIGGSESDQLVGNDGDDLGYAGGAKDRLVGGTGDDTLYGQAGNDLLLGQEDHDTLDGGAGRDKIIGGAGNDVLVGGGGRDLLNGSTGKDVLSGGAGRDILIGGRHSDSLTGGAGSDRFVFSKRSGVDTITDFDSAEDQLLFKKVGLSDISDLEITQQGDNVLVEYNHGKIVLLDTVLDDVLGADFLFA